MNVQMHPIKNKCFKPNLKYMKISLGSIWFLTSLQIIMLENVIKDALLRLNLSFSRCRGQCYDGSNNMKGAINGLSKQISDIESKALYTHCYGHSLNLAAGDTIKGCKLLQDALDITFEISRLVNIHQKETICLICKHSVKISQSFLQWYCNITLKSYTKWLIVMAVMFVATFGAD